jgi:hypothetical protein
MSRTTEHLPGAPLPHDGELLYSALARTARAFGMRSPKRIADALLGSRNALAVPDLPNRLDFVHRWAGSQWRLSLENMILHRTAAAYYASTRGALGFQRIAAALKGEGKRLHIRLGVCTSVIADTSHFRLCPLCTAEDLAARGETHWRRSHQLPGVLVCPAHGVPLSITEVPFRSPRRNVLVAAHADHLAGARPSIAPDHPSIALLLRLAHRLDALARRVPDDRCHRERAHAARLAAAYTKRDAVNTFARDLLKFVGGDVPAILFRPGVDARAWALSLARNPRRAAHPVLHGLLQEFVASLEVSSSPTVLVDPGSQVSSAAPQLRLQAAQLAEIGYRTGAIARTLGVAWKTAARLLAPLPAADQSSGDTHEPLKSKWLELARSNPSLSRKQLRALKPALYAALYRADREWLLANGPKRQPPRVGKRRDWAQRDAELSAHVEACAMRMRREGAVERLSANRLLKETRLRALVQRKGHLLPETRACLERSEESIEAYQLRRVAAAVRTHGDASPDWMILRSARINPDRFDDRGAALLASGRRLASRSP